MNPFESKRVNGSAIPETVTSNVIIFPGARERADYRLAKIGETRELYAARAKAWTKAKAGVGMAKAGLEAVQAAYIFDRDYHGRRLSEKGEQKYWDGRDNLMTIYRNRVAEQLLAPAPDKEAIKWKERTLKYPRQWLGAITEDEIRAAIQADVDFMMARPRRAGGRRPRFAGRA